MKFWWKRIVFIFYEVLRANRVIFAPIQKSQGALFTLLNVLAQFPTSDVCMVVLGRPSSGCYSKDRVKKLTVTWIIKCWHERSAAPCTERGFVIQRNLISWKCPAGPAADIMFVWALTDPTELVWLKQLAAPCVFGTELWKRHLELKMTAPQRSWLHQIH